MIDNPFWAAVKDWVKPDPDEDDAPTIMLPPPDGALAGIWSRLGYSATSDERRATLDQYGWFVPDPIALEFVAAFAGPRALDPCAYNGYMAYLLGQLDVDVLSYDLPRYRPRPEDRTPQKMWAPVRTGHAPYVAKRHGRDRTLILSWPSQGPTARQTLAAYRGDTVIFWGDHRFTGDDVFTVWLMLAWEKIAEHQPTRWGGLHDVIEVYRRRDISQGFYFGDPTPGVTFEDLLNKRLSLPALMALLARLIDMDGNDGR